MYLPLPQDVSYKQRNLNQRKNMLAAIKAQNKEEWNRLSIENADNRKLYKNIENHNAKVYGDKYNQSEIS